MTEHEIETMKARIEDNLKDAEEAAFTLEMWERDWRQRMTVEEIKREVGA